MKKDQSLKKEFSNYKDEWSIYIDNEKSDYFMFFIQGDKPKPEEVDWSNKFSNLTQNERSELLEILCTSRKKFEILNAYRKSTNGKLKKTGKLV